MNEIGFNSEFTNLGLRHDMLREQVANQLEAYTHLVEVVGPNLKADYMMKIGLLEGRAFELKVEINRWKRRFALRQQALNRGEKPDLLSIEAQLDREFATYLEKVKRHLDELKEAALLHQAVMMSEKETAEMRYAYLNAVKKLHPDINPDLPESARDLWNQIQNAYAAQDWDQVRFLAGLVDSVVSGAVTFEASENGLAALREAIGRLEARSREIAARTADLKLRVPFTYEVLLEDEELVESKQDALHAQIKALEEHARKYEEKWNHVK